MPSKTISRPAANLTARFAPDVSQPYLLSNQQLTSLVSWTGAGGVSWKDLAVTRWRADRTADAEGYFVYLRDLDRGEFWSASYQPTLKATKDLKVRARGNSIEFSRSEHQIRSVMKICLASDCDVELRSCTLTNQSSVPRRLELTSYMELALQDPVADRAHPAFSKLFIETECLESGLLLARRRKREAEEVVLSAAHFLVSADGMGADELETDRCRFIGRGQTLCRPRAMESVKSLSGTVGSVLDPVLSLRKYVDLAPNESACVVFGIAASLDAEELSQFVHQFASLDVIDKTFAVATNASRKPSLYSVENKAWRHDSPAPSELLLAAGEDHASRNGGAVGGSSASKQYSPPACDNHETDNLPNAEALAIRNSKATAESLQFDNGWGGFSADGTEYVMRVGRLPGNATNRPPMPWVNVIANPKLGFIVSESGAGYTWSENSRLNRLTPWQNDPVCDPHSEALYIRDEQTGVFWSPTPGPVPQECEYEVRHGFGYTQFSHTSHQLKQEVVQFVPCEDAVKVTCVRLQNLSNQTRELSLFSYHQWELGDGSSQSSKQTKISISNDQKIVFATTDQRGEFSTRTAYASLVSGQSDSMQYCTGDRREFLGQDGRLADPAALQTGDHLSAAAGIGLDPCAACQTTVQIRPGESLDYIVLLGESLSRNEAVAVVNRYQSAQDCHQALAEVKAFWREKLSVVQIQTPSPAIDLLVNGWLSYQNLSCRLWGRSSTYQSGGAYGFRDQLQDAAAWIHQWPSLTREQIVRNAAHQFIEGDVLHWWHPPTSRGIRTAFSDDLLWLPLFAAEYVEATGDHALWEENVRFLSGPALPEGSAEIMLTAEDSGETGSIYEHCCRALDHGLTTGQHGLPLMGCGDWNDGMNRVGQGGQGESVWLGFFIDYVLSLMLPVCKQFGDQGRLRHYQDYRSKLRIALNDAGWDGDWYRRAYFDDGSPLGTASSEECQIDALVQAWAVLSGAAPADRAAQAMAAADQRLVDQQAGVIQLLAPPFDQMVGDPGYIKGYLPGIRENGGQYTHGVLWFVRAVAELGQGSRAVELMEMLSPISHTRNAAEVNTYQTEPYVVAADVYSQPPHAGRGGWSWYTGSAGWMWRVAVESILGVRLKSGKKLLIDPRISASWPECRIQYRLPASGTSYEILILNPNGHESGVQSASLDGEKMPVRGKVAEIPLSGDGKQHRVEISL